MEREEETCDKVSCFSKREKNLSSQKLVHSISMCSCSLFIAQISLFFLYINFCGVFLFVYNKTKYFNKNYV